MTTRILLRELNHRLTRSSGGTGIACLRKWGLIIGIGAGTGTRLRVKLAPRRR